MPICFICKQCLSSIKNLNKHFQFKHSTHDFSMYMCVENDCNRSFHLLNSFKKHLSTHMSETLSHDNTSPLISNTSMVVNSCTSVSDFILPVNNSNYPASVTVTCFDNQSIIETQYSNLIASLYSNPQVPRNVVQSVVEGVNGIVGGIKNSLINTTSLLLTDDSISTNIFESLNLKINNIDNNFTCFNSEYKRMKYYSDLGTFILPQEFIIGERLNENRNKNCFTITPTNCTEQLVPLRKVLKKFLELKNVLVDTLEYMNKIKSYDTIIVNFIQGSIWQKKINNHKNQLVLPIFLFFDDYEVGNPLGSKSGVHKLGAVYLTLPTIPSHQQSSLKNIFLALLFHSSDRLKFGNNIMFRPLIDELNFLRDSGIDIEIPMFKGNIKFELAIILGDNLGIHSITGFVESFSANYPCRICKVRKEVLKTQCYADESLSRSVEQYNIDVLEGDISNSGISESCVWHDVRGFQVLDQTGVDIMHDFLEGVCKYDLSFLISYYVLELKMFSLQVLNERILFFDFGPDKGSKPSVLNMDHIKKSTVKLSASEMMSFVRYFGLIIGDFIPQNDPVWELYILMRKIFDILISTSFQKGCSELLQTLVAEHNELYIKYSKSHLKPKFHYLLHYHSMMDKFGPLILLWSMRFEAKHRMSKIAANTSSNRRNICKTLAIRHQLQLNGIFIKGSLGDEIEFGPSIEINNVDSIINEINKFININTSSLIKYAWITIKGSKYQPKMVLTLDIQENHQPKFGLINSIFICNDKIILFQCSQLNTTEFNEHFFSFEVSEENAPTIFISYDSLPSFVPNNINVISNGKRYITVRGGL